MKFKLHDIRESKVWKEAHEEGDAERLRKTVETLLAKGKSLAEIAELLDIPLDQLRMIAENHNLRSGQSLKH
jgi:predicted transposase YdaD